MREQHDRGARVLVAGGGTGGHVFPALAVASELETRGWSVTWVGREQGMERSLVEDRGFDYRALEARRWVGQGPMARASALLTLLASVAKARRLVLESAAAVTIGTGGFVSAPAVIASFLARRPIVLVEPNARSGMANRWLSRLSTAACVGYEDTAAELSCPSHWTGIPVRSDFMAVAEEPGGAGSILVVGGSQGALQINELMPAVVEHLADRMAGLSVVHQVGSQHLEAVSADYEKRSIEGVQLKVVRFIDDMAGAMRNASVIISRAGALTLAEIAASGRASILVPLEAAGGHQSANAQRLLAAGAAETLEPGTVTEARLAEALERLLADHAHRGRMAAAARSLARPDAAARIADVVEAARRAA